MGFKINHFHSFATRTLYCLEQKKAESPENDLPFQPNIAYPSFRPSRIRCSRDGTKYN